MEDVFTSRIIDLILIIVVGGMIVLSALQEKKIAKLEDKINKIESSK